MRLTLFLAFLCMAQSWAIESSSQEARFTMNMKNAKLTDVLNRIENESEYFFLFNQQFIDVNRPVNIDVKQESIEGILSRLFEGTSVNYVIKDRQIVLVSGTTTGQAPQPTQRTVSGTVTGKNGEPLPGVTVVIKDTSNGTITGADGKFSIRDANPDQILVFSFIGMESQEVIVGSRSMLNITLQESNIDIDEIVAIGYGTVKKSDLTGSVGFVQGDVIAGRQATQISSALQGTLPGVMVTRDNNAPGATATIRIRGITTISDNDPLIIVDGVPVGGINDINPNDVESISVLKDAASASIYGSRAAAGVILVTTKRAKSGELAITYNAEFGIEKPTELSDYTGAVRYMQMYNEMGWNDNKNIDGGEFPTYSKDVIDNYASLHNENPDLYPDTDWTDLILKNHASRQSHRLNITGGSKTISTRVSIVYDEVDGLYMYKNYKRLMGRFNNDIRINQYLSASVDLFVKRAISKNPSMDPMFYMRVSAPVYAAVWTNGMISEGKTGNNIYGQLKEGGYKNYWYNQVGGKASLDFSPVEGLKLSAVVAPEFNYNKGKEFLKKVQYTNYNDPTTYVGTLQWSSATKLNESRSESYNVTTQFLANYVKTFDKHNLNLMAGYENYYKFSESLGASSDKLEMTSFPYLDLGNSNFLSNSGNAYENAYRSWFGRVMYNYNSKYFLQGNVRYDGSSRFDKDYRWGTFPSFSAGWIISEEPFLRNTSALSFLKLRASWGTLGNERVGNYPYQASIGFSEALFYQGTNIVSTKTAAQWAYAIKDISWETTESFDIGVDAQFFDSRLRFTGDIFKKTTKDMLLELEIPDYIGFDNPQQNTGKMDTKGWEIELSWQDRIGDLTYSVSANLFDSKSKMGDLGGIEFLGDQVKFKDSEYNEWYGYKSEGLYQTQDEIDNSATLNANVRPGDLRYADISGPGGEPDGVISSDYDRVLLGGSLPRYSYGGNILLAYKNFDLALAFQGVGKQNVRKTERMVRSSESWGNFPKLIDGKYWSHYNTEEQNLQADYPRLTYNNISNNYAMSDYWMFNGGYFRIKNITLGYTVPSLMVEKIRLQGIRIFGSISDVWSVNNYPKGWDPEVSSDGYPITTSFICGISVKF